MAEWHATTEESVIVSVFVEKYLLSITAALTVLLIATNPMKFDWRQRVTGALALILSSYFCAHTMEIRRETAKAPGRCYSNS